jgi:CRISPR-associated DxTHG motif protein
MKLILSFLGTGRYEQADYPLDGQIYSTPYTQEALIRRYPDYSLKVLLTEKAKDTHGQALRERVVYQPVDIPTGRTEEELWDIFNRIVEAVPEEASLIMDVSHGFRSQPILALAVVQLLQVVKRVKVERILYGFFDPETKQADFFDLTSFLELMEWTQATRDLLEYGNGSRLRQLLKEIHRQSHLLEGPKARKLSNLGDSLDGVGKALELIRPREVFLFSRRTLEHLEKTYLDVESLPRSKPLGLLLGGIEERYKPLALDEKKLFSKEGIGAALKMAELLLQTQSYAQALALMREIVVSEVARQSELDLLEDRDLVERMLNLWAKLHSKGKLEAQRHHLALLWQRITDARNDVMHAGMRKEEKPAQTLAASIDELYKDVHRLLAMP